MRRTRKPAAIVVAGIAAAMLVAAAPPASAEPSPDGCPPGNFCAWSGWGRTGAIVVRTKGDWNGRVGFRSFFNNGVRFPGADHVDITALYANGTRHTQCVHYNPGPGLYAGDVADATVLESVRWRGEC
jgi:Peptidase inhibitor family I36